MFSRYSNIYFNIGRKIINAVNENGSILKTELRNIINSSGNIEDNIDFLKAITGTSNSSNKFHGIDILEDKNEVYISKIENIPLTLSSSEITALKNSLSIDIASAFVSEEVLLKFGIKSSPSNLAKKLKNITTAIKTDKWIVFDNMAGSGKYYYNQHLKPQKIEYTFSRNEFLVSVTIWASSSASSNESAE